MPSIRDCKAMTKVPRRLAESLRLAGRPGLLIRKDRQSGEPVFYLWQAFQVVRIDWESAKELAEIVESVRKAERRRTKKAGGGGRQSKGRGRSRR